MTTNTTGKTKLPALVYRQAEHFAARTYNPRTHLPGSCLTHETFRQWTDENLLFVGVSTFRS